MKIKIKSKGFPTFDLGYMEAEKEYEVTKSFAVFCVEKMKSADYVEAQKKQVRRTSRKVK